MDSWAQALAATRRVEVFECGMASSGEPLTPGRPLVVDGAEVAGLLEALAITELSGASCMCLGETTFHLMDADGGVLARAGLHHGTSLRWDGWDSDAMLRDGPGLVQWLDAHGMSGPAAEADASQARRAAEERTQREWVEACPQSAVPLLDGLLLISRTGSQPAGLTDRLEQALSAEFPDRTKRCAALLRWYAAGSGRRSGHPMHEKVPDDLLRTFPIDEIIEVAASSDDVDVLLGAARHLSGWKARTPMELATVPSALAARLTELSSTHGRTDVATELESLLRR